MKILVLDNFLKYFSLECESTDTIAHLRANLGYQCTELMFDGKWVDDEFSDDMTLADIGIQEGSLIRVVDSSFLLKPRSKSGKYVRSTMKIVVVDSYETGKVFSLECESTDTIAHLKAKLKKITGISLRDQSLTFDGKQLGDNLSENMTLAEVGIQDGSLILHSSCFEVEICSAGILEGPPRRGPPRRPENDYLYYADAFKSGWREEQAKALMHLVLKLCQSGTISEGHVTDEAWFRIQNSLNNSMQFNFQIEFLKERLRDYRQLYSILTEASSSIFNWDRERKTITITSEDDWREEYPELLLLCGPYIPYFDTLEEVCLLLNTGQSSEQRVTETSTNREQVHQDIPRLSKLRSFFCLCQQS